jgi:hypothetical protein
MKSAFTGHGTVPSVLSLFFGPARSLRSTLFRQELLDRL